jgi:hypothetical protein
MAFAFAPALVGALVSAAAADGPGRGPIMDDSFRIADRSSEQLLTMTWIYGMALLVGWLVAGSLIIGILIGLTGQRRAASWAIIIAAAFFWGIVITGGGMPADAAARLFLAGGGLAMLAAAAVGQRLGGLALRSAGTEETPPASRDQAG